MEYLLFFFFPLLAGSEPTLIPWTDSRKLDWSDFSAPVPPDSEADAFAFCEFNHQAKWIEIDGEVVVQLDASAFIDPSRSWVKEEMRSKELLAHLQVYFNIAELQCRYFRQQVYRFHFGGADFDYEFNQIVTMQKNRLALMQQQYDAETDHGRNTEEQARWTKFVSDELERLREFD